MILARILPVRCGRLLWLAGCLGCTDRLTAPEAIRLFNAMEPGLSRDTVMQQFYLSGALQGLLGDLRDLRAPPPYAVTVLLDGRPVAYHALVFDRNPIPPPDLSPGGKCRFVPTRTLILWRLGEVADGFYLSGRDYSAPLREGPTRCPEAVMSTDAADMPPWLHMFRLVLDSAGGVRSRPPMAWASVSGTANVSPGEDAGDCGLTPEDARAVYEWTSATCRRATYRVRFRATLRQADLRAGPYDQRTVGTATLTVELPETEVIGGRYTLHCDERPLTGPCVDDDKKLLERSKLPR
jgi:hypothetical protein